MLQKKLKRTMKALVTNWILSTYKLHNKVHERALRIVSKNNFSSFEKLLSKSKPVTVHERNLLTLATGMYTVLNSLSSEIKKVTLKLKLTTVILLTRSYFSKEMLKTVRCDLETMSYTSPKIWDLVPNEMKQVTPLNELKTKIKIWKLENGPCRLSRSYLPELTFGVA